MVKAWKKVTPAVLVIDLLHTGADRGASALQEVAFRDAGDEDGGRVKVHCRLVADHIRDILDQHGNAKGSPCGYGLRCGLEFDGGGVCSRRGTE
jgi:hypothetical protein